MVSPGSALEEKAAFEVFPAENGDFRHVRVAEIISNLKLGLKPAASG